MKLQNVRGTQDILPEDQKYWDFVFNVIDKSSEINGFEKINTPIIEYLDLFEKGTGENTEVVSKQMFEVSRFGNEKDD